MGAEASDGSRSEATAPSASFSALAARCSEGEGQTSQWGAGGAGKGVERGRRRLGGDLLLVPRLVCSSLLLEGRTLLLRQRRKVLPHHLHELGWPRLGVRLGDGDALRLEVIVQRRLRVDHVRYLDARREALGAVSLLVLLRGPLERRLVLVRHGLERGGGFTAVPGGTAARWIGGSRLPLLAHHPGQVRDSHVGVRRLEVGAARGHEVEVDGGRRPRWKQRRLGPLDLCGRPDLVEVAPAPNLAVGSDGNAGVAPSRDRNDALPC